MVVAVYTWSGYHIIWYHGQLKLLVKYLITILDTNNNTTESPTCTELWLPSPQPQYTSYPSLRPIRRHPPLSYLIKQMSLVFSCGHHKYGIATANLLQPLHGPTHGSYNPSACPQARYTNLGNVFMRPRMSEMRGSLGDCPGSKYESWISFLTEGEHRGVDPHGGENFKFKCSLTRSQVV